MKPPVLYLDTCTLNRLTDDLSQPRLFAEAGAVRTIFTLIQAQQVRWIASTLLAHEISRNPNPYKRVFASSLLPAQQELVAPLDSTITRATHLAQQGLTAADALHLALAEEAHADWFVSTDDRLLRRTANRMQLPECINPVDWLRRRQLWLVPKS